MIEFKYRDVFWIFVMLVGVTTVIFGLGVFLGKEFRTVRETKMEVYKNSLLIEESPVAHAPQEKILPPSPPKTLEGYTIQINFFEKNEQALQEKERILKLGFPSVFVRESLIDHYPWFVVDLGFFKEKQTAVRLASQLQSKGVISSYIVRRSSLDDPKEIKN